MPKVCMPQPPPSYTSENSWTKNDQAILLTLTGFLYGSFHINVTGSNLCLLGRGRERYRNGSNVIETWNQQFDSNIIFRPSFNPLPHNAAFWCTKNMQLWKNIVRKVEITCHKQFLLFSQCFLPYMGLILHFKCTFKMSSAICFNLDQTKILSSGNGLISCIL